LKLKIIHLPTSVGGNPQGLSEHLNKIGYKSVCINFETNYLDYKSDINLEGYRSFFLIKEILKWWYLIKSIIFFDIIHYNYGTTIARPICWYKPNKNIFYLFLRFVYSRYTLLFQKLELSLLKFFKKKMFVHYQGDDARQGDFSSANFKYSISKQVGNDYYNRHFDNFKRKQIKIMNEYCTQIYSLNPDLLHVLPNRAKFLPYSHISLQEWKPKYFNNNERIIFGHAPSNRKAKGTDEIINVINRLKNEKNKFDFKLIEGVSNQDAKKQYADIDILIDQIYAGWYGGLAVELMALGKPVIVYIRKEDLDFIPTEMREELPFIEANPENIYEVIKNTIHLDKEVIKGIGKKSRLFVEKWHDPKKIASEIILDYKKSFEKSK
tara:strand:+ start:464 stop:1603 length:1140 start_codon:yes stop_codon:yes gene_type:complete